MGTRIGPFLIELQPYICISDKYCVLNSSFSFLVGAFIFIAFWIEIFVSKRVEEWFNMDFASALSQAVGLFFPVTLNCVCIQFLEIK